MRSHRDILSAGKPADPMDSSFSLNRWAAARQFCKKLCSDLSQHPMKNKNKKLTTYRGMPEKITEPDSEESRSHSAALRADVQSSFGYNESPRCNSEYRRSLRRVSIFGSI